jgi:lysophospholipase L1-like esterase
VARFNQIILEEAGKRSLAMVDLFDVSQQMGNDRSLVAGDGLHPSGKEYAEWERLIYPEAIKTLQRE